MDWQAAAATLREERDAAMQAAQAAIRDTTRLTRLLAVLTEAAPLEKLLDRVLSTLSELFHADVVALLTPIDGSTCATLASIGFPEDISKQNVPATPDTFVGRILRDGAPSTAESANSQAGVDPRFRELDIEAAVWLPVTASRAIAGVLLLGRCLPESFANTDVDLLNAMAYRIGLALEQAQHGRALEQLVRNGQQVTRHIDEAAVLDRAVRAVPSILRADAAAVALLDASGNARCAARSGFDADQAEALNQQVQLVARDSGLPQVHGLPAALAVPIMQDARADGVLYVFRRANTHFSVDAVQIATLYAGQVAGALDAARLYHAAREELAERTRAEDALRASEERLRALVSRVSDVITIVEGDGTTRYVSPACAHDWGCEPRDVIGHNALERVHLDDVDALRELLDRARLEPGGTFTGCARLQSKPGTWGEFEIIVINLLDDPAVAGLVITYHDVTERKAFEAELSRLAFRDSLTGLANRTLFSVRLEQALEQASARSQRLAVLFIDLDNFKIVNDSLGHGSGDRVLVGVAERLRTCLRIEDTAARLGGDEFTVLVPNVTDTDDVGAIAERIAAALQAPLSVDGHEVFIGASIGIAVSSPSRERPDELLRRADLAMYRAKSGGKGCYAVFDQHLDSGALERLELESGLRRALDRAEFRVHYQPIVSLKDSTMLGVEALVRWQRQDHELLRPSEFILLAEETGVIVPLGRWVLEAACQQVQQWQTEFPWHAPLELNVNLSARQLQHAGLLADVEHALRISGLDPPRLTLEITESAVMQDADRAIATLLELKTLGIHLAIDDFGTGKSSLGHLKRLPVDTLKIDRSFIHGLGSDVVDAAIVRSMVGLAGALELRVIGEGVETLAQKARLVELGCKYGQGSYFAGTLAPTALRRKLGARPTSRVSAQVAGGRAPFLKSA